MDWVLDNRVVLINVAYLIAAVCFIVGLKLLSSPATARRGNQIAALGMAVAVVATLFDVIVLNKEPADEEVPTVLFPAKDAETTS